MVNFNHQLPRSVKIVSGRKNVIVDYCRGKKVLHIGCTDSGLVRERMDASKHLHLMLLKVAKRVWGADIDRDGLDVLREIGVKDLFLHNAEELDTLKLDDQPEVMVASEIMEHLNSPGYFLHAARKFNCELIVSVPNAFSYRIFKAMQEGRELVHEDHNYYYSYVTLKSLIEKHGWALEECMVYYSDAGDPVTKEMFQMMQTNPFFGEGLIFRMKPVAELPGRGARPCAPTLTNTNGQKQIEVSQVQPVATPSYNGNGKAPHSVVTSSLPATLPPLTIGSKPLKITFFAGDSDNFHFVNPIIEHYRQSGADVRVVKSEGLTQQTLHAHLQRNDVAWFEWANGPVVAASRLPKVCHMICRLHRYEAYSNSPAEINWNNIDDLIFIAPQTAEFVCSNLGAALSHTKIHVIPNAVDLTKIPLKQREKGFNIAYVARFSKEKNIPLLMQIMAELVKIDPRWKCYYAGRMQDLTLLQYFEHLRKAMKLEDNLIYVGAQDDIYSWLEDKQYILSTSYIEGHPVNVLEGMALGLKPVLHNYYGDPASAFGSKYVFNTVQEAVGMFLSEDYNSAEYRRVIEERYSETKQFADLDKIVLSSMQAPVAHPIATVNPLISVVIFTYNRSGFIVEAIESVLAQDYAKLEMLVVDDGSTDDTEAKVKAIRDERVRYFKVEHRGGPTARNFGISQAKGDFIIWLGSDDVMMPRALSRYAEAVAQNPEADVFYGDYMITHEDLSIMKVRHYENFRGRNAEMLEKLFKANPMADGGTLFRKSLFERLGGYNEEFLFATDYEFWSRNVLELNFHHIGAPVYKYRQHPGNITSTDLEYRKQFQRKIVKGMLKRYTIRQLFPSLQWDRFAANQLEAEAWGLIADRLLNLGDLENALAALEKSRDLYPNEQINALAVQLRAIVTSKSISETGLGEAGSNGNGKVHAVHVPSMAQSSTPETSIKSDYRPFVSILIPTYNRAQYIEGAVQSALSQNYDNFEVVVVDDGSTDASLEILAGMIDSRLHVVRAEHIGAPACRNRAIAEARGEFILWLDSDDQLLPGAIANHVAALNGRDDLDIVYGDLEVADAEMNLVGVERYEDWDGREQQLVARLFYGNTVPNPGTLIRRTLFQRVGGYDETFNWSHDFEFWSRAVGMAHFKHCGKMVCRYRRHAENLSLEKAQQYRNLDARVVKGMLARYKLPRLFPTIDRNLSPVEAEAQGCVTAADRLLQLEDYQAALEWIRKAHSLVGSPQTRDLLETAEGLAGGYGMAASAVKPLRIVAIISAFNEGDIISQVIRELVTDNIEVYLIDHCSTDDTVLEASKWLGNGLIKIEHYPEDSGRPPQNGKVYAWGDILTRKEELARELGADWYLHADADEFRETPWPNMSLREGIELVDRLGYNAIGFDVLNFRPVDDDFRPGDEVRECLTYFERPGVFDLDQIKAWKHTGARVDLASTGGHIAEFEGRKVFPVPFLLRHYPIRGKAHGLKKVFNDRIPRFQNEERKKGWHVQYDVYRDQGAEFIWDAKDLTLYDPHQVRSELLGKALRDFLLLSVFHPNAPMNKVENGELAKWLGGVIGRNSPIPSNAVQILTRGLIERFYTELAGRQALPAVEDEGILKLMQGLSEVNARLNAFAGAYKAAGIWGKVEERIARQLNGLQASEVQVRQLAAVQVEGKEPALTV